MFRKLLIANRGEIALLAPTLVQTGYGERPGQAPRALDIEAPLGTVVHTGDWKIDLTPELCGKLEYQIRIFPSHPALIHKFEPGLMIWL